MALTFMTTKFVPGGMSERLDRFFAGVGQGLNAYLLTKDRMRELHRLNACSDAQLSSLGITREDIPRYVFRDLLT